MDMLASLEVVSDSSSVKATVKDLNDLTASAPGAERAVEGVGRSMKRVDPHAQNLNRALQAQERQMRTIQMAGLNMSRQFADIGVSLASGMSPLLVLIQQGPQIADGFQTAATQGASFGVVMRGLWTQVAPLVAILGPFAIAAGLAAAAFGLLHRELSKSYPKDVTDGLGLTEAQLKRVEDKAVTFGDTFKATFTVLARHIAASPVGDMLEALGQTAGSVLDWIAKKWLDSWAVQLGVAVGTLKTIIQSWQQFPALMGEIVGSAANIFSRAVETMVNRQIDGFNAIGRASNLIFKTSFDPIAHLDLPEVEEKFAGTAANMGEALRRNVTVEIANARAALVSLGKEIGDEALAQAIKRALEQAGDPAKGRQPGKSDLEKSIEDTVAYIKALRDLAATYGMNAIAAKQYEIDQRITAAATSDLKDEVRKYGEALIEKMRIEAVGLKPMQNQLDMLNLELQLVGATNRQRAVEIALLTKRQQMEASGLKPSDPRWADGENAARELGETQDKLAVSIFAANDALTYQLDLLTQIDNRARDAAGGMADAFGVAGRALGDLLSLTTSYSRRQEEIYVRRSELLKQAGLDEQAIARIIVRSNEESAAAQIAYYGDVLGAARGFFGEQTAAYKALAVAEQAYRAIQFALSIKAMVVDAAETGSKVAQSAIRATAYASEAIANAFKSIPFPFNIAAGAATAAALLALGVKVMGGGGSSSMPSLPTTNTGTGTVLGDSTAQSQSISKSVELAERYYDRDLGLSNAMLDALKAIERGIDNVTTAIARQLGIGGKLSTDGLGLGSTSNPGFLGMFSSSRSSSLADQGLNFGGQNLGQIIENGIAGQFYQIVQNTKTKSGIFGIGGGTTTWNTETSSGIDAGLSRDIANLLASLKGGVLSAAGVLGLEGAEAVLNAFQVNIGRISFKDMSSAEIAETLTAVFSAVGDQMAGAIMPTLTKYQQAGEGLMETLTRLAAQYQAVDQVMASLGMSFGAVGVGSIEARDRLVQLSGGLEEFVKSSTFFAEEFLTEAQRIAPIQSALNAELTRLGLSTTMTREQFASVVTGLDVSTEAGAKMYAALLNLAPAFAKVLDYTEDLTEANQTAALALVGKARDDLTKAYQREATALQQTIDRFGGFADGLRAFRKELDMTGAGEASYGATRAEFERVAALARLGDAEAMAGLQGVSKTFLDAAMSNATSQHAYLRDLALVKSAVDLAADTADRTKSAAERQLEALDASVAGLITINESVLSVHDAILALREAMTTAGQLGITQFARGGVFTTPTYFDIGQMAEAGPEAIMPLHQGPNGLGVRAVSSGDGELIAEIRALRQEVAELKAAAVQTTVNTAQTTRQLQRWDGDGMPEGRSAA